MPFISTINVATARHQVGMGQLQKFAYRWLENSPNLQEKLMRVANASGVTNRNLVIEPNSIIELGGMQMRSALYQQLGVELILPTLDNVILGKKPELYLTSSCSLPVIPSIDTLIIEASDLSRSIARIPIFQHGCAGGVIALSLADKFSKASNKNVLISAIELCSLVFQPKSFDDVQILAACLFADGAASLIIEPNCGNLEIIDTFSYLLPETTNIMGYDLLDDGFYLRLDRSLPNNLIKFLPSLVNNFLGRSNLTTDDIRHWLFHPGGKKILDNLQNAFAINYEQCHWSYDVLSEFGNMSSATIFYVLKKFIDDTNVKDGKVLIVGIGPGLTLELILCNYRK